MWLSGEINFIVVCLPRTTKQPTARDSAWLGLTRLFWPHLSPQGEEIRAQTRPLGEENAKVMRVLSTSLELHLEKASSLTGKQTFERFSRASRISGSLIFLFSGFSFPILSLVGRAKVFVGRPQASSLYFSHLDPSIHPFGCLLFPRSDSIWIWIRIRT